MDFWVEKLDQPISSGQLSTFVYYIQNAEAEKLSGVLNTLFGEKKKGSILGGAPKPKSTQRKNAGKTPKSKSPVQKTKLKVQGGVDSDLIGDSISFRMWIPIP